MRAKPASRSDQPMSVQHHPGSEAMALRQVSTGTNLGIISLERQRSWNSKALTNVHFVVIVTGIFIIDSQIGN